MSKQFTGVILAAGAGTRMDVIGDFLPKACLPLGQSPLIHHHLELFRVQGVREVVVVVGYLQEKVRHAVARYPQRDAFESIRFVEQEQRLGIAHALLMVEPLVQENMVVILGDTYFVPDRLHEPMEIFESKLYRGLGAVLSVRVESNPAQIRKECSIRLDEEGRLVEIKEKPGTPFNHLKPCGMYFFTHAIFDAIRNTPASDLRNEVEISDAIQVLADSGLAVRCARSVLWDMNLNTVAELWWCNQVHLRRLGGGVWSGDNLSIGSDADIEESILGNDVQISAGVSLKQCLVFEGEVVDGAIALEDSVIAYGAVIKASEQDQALLPEASEEIISSFPESVRFRPAAEADCARLFRWVRSAESHSTKLRTSEPTSRQVFLRWFAASLSSSHQKIWIIEGGGRSMGQVRIEKDGAGVGIELYIEPRFRSRGFGLEALNFAKAKVESLWPSVPVFARMELGNYASMKLFEKAGYRLETKASDHCVFRLLTDGGERG